MGRKAKLRQGRNRQAPLGFGKASPRQSYEELGPGGLSVSAAGFEFYATEVVTGTKQVESLVQQFNREGAQLPKDVLVMPFDVRGRGGGLAFFDQKSSSEGVSAMEFVSAMFVPNRENDKDALDFFQSGEATVYLYELFCDLMVQGKIVSPSPIFFSVSQ